MRFGLRAMRWWDIEALVPVERQLFAGDPPWTAEQFWSELAGVPESRWYLVAEADGERVGYAGLSIWGETADIQTVAVVPAHQRQGIGSRLLEALLTEARSRGAAEVLLEVRVDNAPARAMYAKQGFGRTAFRRGYYADGGDGLVLRRRLPRARTAPVRAARRGAGREHGAHG